MPKGPPPYPVAFKEFFITDPKTGKQTMKVQMFPSDKQGGDKKGGDQKPPGPPKPQNEMDEVSEADYYGQDPAFWNDYLDHYS